MKLKHQHMGRDGDILLEVIIFGGIFIIMASGFVLWALSFLNFSVRDLNRSTAFAISEAGLEYYRWHLAHAPFDFQDGTGQPGPYTHNYYNKEGDILGQFILDITPPLPGSTVVTVKSTGHVLADSSVEKIVLAKFAIPSFAQYAVALNSDVSFGSGTETFGVIMSNGGIRFDGLAHNLVKSAVACYTDPDYNQGSNEELGVYTRVPTIDPYCPSPPPDRPDVFMAGRTFPVPALDFTQITQTLSILKAQAVASSTYYASSSVFGYELVFSPSGNYTIYKVTALADPPNGCTNTSHEDGWGTWSVQSKTPFATGIIPDNGVIFVEDNLWVSGQIQNKHVTVGAGRFPDNSSTWANITINSSTLYSNYTGSDTLALVAQNNFNVGLFSEDVLRIDAAILAQNGRVGRYYYSPPNLQNNAQKCGSTATRQEITLYGSIISNLRYGFGFTDETGYIKRNLIYDSNLLYSPPPSFPLLSDHYTQIFWEEVK